MMEDLKKSKELYLKKQAESEIESEKEKQRQYEEMLRIQEKKRNFEIFLKQKGIEASNFLKDMQEKKNRQNEEIHRFEKKIIPKEKEEIKKVDVQIQTEYVLSRQFIKLKEKKEIKTKERKKEGKEVINIHKYFSKFKN